MILSSFRHSTTALRVLPEAEEFLDRAVSDRHGNEEQRLAARELLARQLDPAAGAECLASATKRIASKRSARVWCWLALVPFLSVVVWLALPYREYARIGEAEIDPDTGRVIAPPRSPPLCERLDARIGARSRPPERAPLDAGRRGSRATA